MQVIVMHILIRVAVAFLLLGFTAFCSFGFMATFEPPGFPVWRLMYGVAGLLGLTGIGWILTRRPKGERVAGSAGR